MKLRLTRSVPLQMQITQPSRSGSVFPTASNADRILGSWGREREREEGEDVERRSGDEI